jgi:AAA domain
VADEPINEDPELRNRAEQLRQQYKDAKPQRGNGPDIPKPNGTDRYFTLIRSKDIKLDTSSSWLVEDLIPKEGLTVVWGPPKCGKTFWTFDLGMHIALKWEYRGRHVEGGTVVYVACEGERGLAARNKAFWKDKLTEDADDPPFYLLRTRLDLPNQVDALILDIAAQIPPEPVGTIVLDTLNRSLGAGRSENRDDDMAAYVTAAYVIRDRFQCAVIIIHHCGIDSARPRGHSLLTGTVDAQLAVSRDAADKVITTIEYLKDGPQGDRLASTLRVVEVGTDNNGKAITSLVVDPADAPEKTGAGKPKPQPLKPFVIIAMRELRTAIATDGKPLPKKCGAFTGINGVEMEIWRQRCYRAGISEGDADSARRVAFWRAVQKLVATEGVRVFEKEWAWIV